MLDTLRADILKTYGGDVPFNSFGNMARRGVTYMNTISPGTYTVTSHVSLFTGKRVTKVEELNKDNFKICDKRTDPFLEKSVFLKSGEMTLARKMSYLGYNTALFSNNPFVSLSTGIGEGFSFVQNIFIDSKLIKNRHSVKAALGMVQNDAVRNNLIYTAYLISRMIPQGTLNRMYFNLRTKLNKHFSNEYGYNTMDKGADYTNRLVGDYAKRVGNEGNFVFVNFMEAHEGYPTKAITDEYVEQDKWMYLSNALSSDNGTMGVIKEAYKRRVMYLDQKVGSLLSNLKKEGMLDDAVVVMAGDHGQAFMEHNVMYHNVFPYNEVVHVPLATARFINGKQVRQEEVVDKNVSLSALHDSILDIAYGRNDDIDGSLRRDNFVFSDHTGIGDVWDARLLRLMRKRIKYADEIYKAKLHHNTFATAIYHKNYKLIHYRNSKMKDELYDVKNDSEELYNVIDKNRGIAREMLKQDAVSS